MISWADMVLASSVAGLFKWRQFEPEVILLAVGWHPLRFSLSYRDVEELLAERGLRVDHVTRLEVGPLERPRRSSSVDPTFHPDLNSGYVQVSLANFGFL